MPELKRELTPDEQRFEEDIYKFIMLGMVNGTDFMKKQVIPDLVRYIYRQVVVRCESCGNNIHSVKECDNCRRLRGILSI